MNEHIRKVLLPLQALRTAVRSLAMPNGLDILFAWGLPLAIVVAFFSKFLVEPGDIFYGDVLPYVRASLEAEVQTQLYIWNNGPMSPYTWFLPFLPRLLVGQVAGPGVAIRFFMVFLAFLPGPAMYWSAKTLFRMWWPGQNGTVRAGAVVSALVYLLANTNAALSFTPTTTWAPSYILLPVLFTLLVRYLRHRWRRDLIALAALSSLANAVPIWLLLLPFLGGLYLAGLLIREREGRRGYAGAALVAALGVVTVNLYVFLPAAIGFSRGLGGPYEFYALGSFGGERITYDVIQAQSFSRLIDVLMLGHPTFFVFHEYPADWTIASVVLPILAFAPLLWRRDAPTLFLATIALIGLFLAKGANPPFGYLYYLLATNSPPGLSGLIFDVTPFAILVALAYALLLGRVILDSGRWARWYISLRRTPTRVELVLEERSLPTTSRRPQILRAAVALAVLGPLLAGSVVDLSGVYSYYGPHLVPEAYHDVARFLESQRGDFKVMWVPASWQGPDPAGALGVNWTKPPFAATGVGFPSQFSSRPAVPPTIVPYLPYTRHIGRVLSLLDVKYVIVHEDAPVNLTPVMKNLEAQQDLRIAWERDFITVFENLEPVAAAWEGPLTYIEGDAHLGDILAGGFDPLSSAWFFARDAPHYRTEALAMASSLILFDSDCSSLSGTQGCPPKAGAVPTSWMGSAASLATGPLPKLNATSESLQRPTRINGIPVVYNASYLTLVSQPEISLGANVTLQLRYTLPPSVVDQGFSGRFHQNFGVMMRASAFGDPNATFATIFPTSQILTDPTSGYLFTTLPVSGKISGPFTLTYLYFDGSFRPLSAWYHLGTFYPRLLGIPSPAPPFGRAIAIGSSSTTVRAFAPLNGTYDLYARAVGNLNLSIGNAQWNLVAANGSLRYLGRLNLNFGSRVFNLSSRDWGMLAYLLLRPPGDAPGSLKPDEAASNSPTSFVVKGVGTGPVVFLAQGYNSGWSVGGGGRPVFALLDSLATGTSVGNESPGSIAFDFTLQQFLYLGDALSVAGLVALILAPSRRFLRPSRRNQKTVMKARGPA